MKKFICLLLLFQNSNILFAQSAKRSIYLELKFEITPISQPLPDSIAMQYGFYPGKLWTNWSDRKTTYKDNAKWIVPADEPIIVYIWGIAIINRYNRWLLEPGDSIVALWREGALHFSGRGADKLNMNNEVYALKEAMPKPSNPSIHTVSSVEDFLEWDSYLNRQMALCETVMESYKELVSHLAMQNAKMEMILGTENQRWMKFIPLTKKKYFDIERQQLCKLYDDHFYTPQAKWLLSQTSLDVAQFSLDGHFFRKYNFVARQEIANNVERNLLFLEFGKTELRGEALEYFLAKYMTVDIMGKIGLPFQVDSALKKYYTDKGRDPECQAYVREYERKKRILKKYSLIPDLSIYDKKKKTYSKNELEGRVVVLNFSKAGSAASEAMTNSLDKVASSFKNDSYAQFLNLPVHLQPDSVIRKFNLTGYPAVFVVDLNGRLITSSFVDSSLDAGKIDEIVKERVAVAKRENWQGSADGPYVLGVGPTRKVYQFLNDKLSKSKSESISLQVVSDEPGKYFSVNLRDNYPKEPSVFSKPEKLLAFSDIEGEFEALRLLLQKNGVIDEDYNWTFAKGHIVFAGDMFDRGEQVTECLWLMYSLEEKAKAAGGYVHFILGNHEIMNLSGNHKYTRPKYKENAEKIGKSIVELYGKSSELGKWLRSKNIVEKIGDILFLHGGISKDVKDLNLTVSQINDLARPWLDNEEAVRSSGDKQLQLLYNSEQSPFWYRDYYLESQIKKSVSSGRQKISYKTPESVIDEILRQYQVNKIVTGHTIWEGVRNDFDRGRWLSVHYDGKVINTDTKHKSGYSEALLVENGKYYAVNENGERRDLNLAETTAANTANSMSTR